MRRLCSPCDLYALALWFPLELTLSHTRDRTWPGVSMVSSPPLAPFHLAVGFQQELKNSKWISIRSLECNRELKRVLKMYQAGLKLTRRPLCAGPHRSWPRGARRRA
jgi:hypothetical protein